MSMDKFYIEDAGGGFGFFPYNTVDDVRAMVAGAAAVRRARAVALAARRLLPRHDVGHVPVRAGRADPGRHQRHADRCRPSAIIDSKNWSAFGQVEFDLAAQWTLIAGLRWSQDDKHLDMRRIFADVPEGVPADRNVQHRQCRDPGHRQHRLRRLRGARAAQLEARRRAHLLYASFNRGIKGGNWSLDPLGAVADENLKHAPEKLKAVRARLEGRSVRRRSRGSTPPRSTTTTRTIRRSRSSA